MRSFSKPFSKRVEALPHVLERLHPAAGFRRRDLVSATVDDDALPF